MANFLQQIDLRKFFKRAIVITSLLAFIEVLIFTFLYYKQNNTPFFSTTSESSFIKSTDFPTQKHSGDLKNNETENNIGNSVTDTIHIKDSTGNQSTLSTTTQESKIIDSTENTDNKLKLLSAANVQMILKKIRAQKRGSRQFNNCIQIRKSSNCNISNAFKIATLLQTKGYIITGRLTYPEPYYGISVTANSGCLQLTIGKI